MAVSELPSTRIECFLSYAREDLEHAIRLAEGLIGNGHGCWCDVRDLVPGAKWQDDVEDAIIRSDLIIVLLSNHSIQSVNVARELRFAVEVGKKIVPVAVEPVDISGEMLELVAPVHWIFQRDFPNAGELAVRIVDAATTDLLRTRQIRDTLVLTHRWLMNPDAAVMLQGASLRAAEQAMAADHRLASSKLRQAVSYLDACRAAERHRARNRVAIISAVAVALTLISITALWQWRLAVARARDNQAAFLASEAIATLREPWLFSSWKSNTRRVALFVANAAAIGANIRFIEPAVELGRLLRPLTQHPSVPNDVSAFALSKDANVGAIATYSGQISIYDEQLQTFQKAAEIDKAIWSIGLNQDGTLLGAIDEDKRAYLLDMRGGDRRVTLLPVEDAWQVEVHSHTQIAVAHGNGGISVSNAGLGRWRRIETTDRVSVLSISGSPPRLDAGTDGGELVIVDLATARIVKKTRITKGPIQHLYRADNGSITFVGGSDGLFELTAKGPEHIPLPIQFGITALAGDSSAGLIAAASWDGAVHVWDTNRREEVARLPSQTREPDGLFFDPKHRLHTIASKEHWSWDLTPRIPRARLSCETGVQAFEAGDGNVWVACRDATVRQLQIRQSGWAATSASLRKPLTWLTTNGARALAGTDDGVWALDVLQGPMNSVRVAGNFSLKPPIAGAGHYTTGTRTDGRGVGVWDSRTGKLVWQDTVSSAPVAVAVSTLSDIVVHCDAEGRCVRQQVSNRSVRHVRSTGLQVQSIAVAPRGDWILITDQTDRLWVWRPMNSIWYELQDVPQPIFATGFLASSERLFVSSGDVHVYDLRSAKKVGVLDHRGEVQAGAASFGKGKMLLTLGYEKVGRLWDGDGLAERARFSTGDVYPFGVYSVGPNQFAVWGDHNWVEVWDLQPEWLIETLCSGTIGTLEEEAWKRVGLTAQDADRCDPRLSQN